MVSIDILGPYEPSRNGNVYLIVAVDLFSKWVELQPVPVSTTNTVITFIENQIFARWGAPETIITDNGAQFLGLRYERLLEVNHIKSVFSPVYHQQANPVERRVQELKKLLKTQLINRPNREWEDHLHTVAYCLRNRLNSAIQQTPAELLLGYTPPRPGAWVLPAIERHTPTPRDERIEKAKSRQIVFERKLFPEPRDPKIQYQPGEPVMVRNHAQGVFQPPWLGPYPVVRKVGETVYSIDRNGSERRVHLNDIRPAPPPRRPPRRRDPPRLVPEPEPIPETEPEPEPISETEPEPVPSIEPESGSEPLSDSEMYPELEPSPEPESEPLSDSE